MKLGNILVDHFTRLENSAWFSYDEWATSYIFVEGSEIVHFQIFSSFGEVKPSQ